MWFKILSAQLQVTWDPVGHKSGASGQGPAFLGVREEYAAGRWPSASSRQQGPYLDQTRIGFRSIKEHSLDSVLYLRN